MHRLAPLAAALLAAAALAACGGDDGATGPNMRPGSDCLGCHGSFAAAGTVFHADGTGAAGVTVHVTVGGTPRTLTTNAAGNFYLVGSGAVTAPSLTSGATTLTMASTPTGHCNGCHGASVAKLTVP
ncbi:MAG TPA: hypothetical protein VFP50_05940 [Anaeromyxobacteraceae bacterium]|nr:hypothetical protein [Anaeromyxobacteraceae bacterium]